MPKPNRVVIFATEPVTGKIGGLGIRQLQVARTLNKHFKVRLLTPFHVDIHKENFPIKQIIYEQTSTFEKDIRWANTVYSISLSVIPVAKKYNKPIVADLLVPEYFENLESMPIGEFNSQEKSDRFANSISRVTRLLTSADFFLCPNEKIRDFYLGMLTQLGRLRPHDYPQDPQFRNLIDVAHFGLPRREPKKGKTLFRNKIPGVGSEDFLIVWGGSLANWFDSLTPIRAMARLKKRLPNAKLVFTGKKHPVWNKLPPAYEEIIQLAKQKGIYNKNVFIYSDWVPYDQHEYYLTEADAGISTFFNHIENHFCFRIRGIDYLWANLPILTNPGNFQSELVKEKDLGCVFPFGDDKALADAIEWMATNPKTMKKMRKNISREKKNFYWDRVLDPLIQFCKNPKISSSLFNHDGISEIRKQNSFTYQPEKLLEVMPNHPHLILEKALKQFKNGNKPKAAKYIQTHMDLFGIGLTSHLFRHPLFGLDAEFNFKELINLIPNHPHLNLLKAKLKLDDQKLQEADQLIKEEESLFGQSLESQFIKGLVFQKMKKYSKALKLFKLVSKAMSEHVAFWLPIADTLLAQKKLVHARKIYVQAWRTSQNGPHSGEEWIRTRSAQAIAKIDSDKRSELETLNLYFNKDSTNETLAQIIALKVEQDGQLLLKKNQIKEAKRFYKKAWKRSGKTAGEGWIRVSAALALAKIDSDKRPEIETFNYLIEENPDNERLAYAIASSLEKQGRSQEAKLLFRKCTATFKAKSLLGSAWYRLALLSQNEEKKTMLKKCLEYYPSHNSARALWNKMNDNGDVCKATQPSLKV